MSIDLSKAVITTKFVLEKQSRIVYVSHDVDGDWQFLGKEDGLSEEDARVVSLGEILKMESSIKDLLWMPEKMQAWWNADKKEWHTSVQE